MVANQQQGTLHLPKEQFLNHAKAVSLSEAAHNPTYGRDLLRAPAECGDGRKGR
jgi:hypothetical protein